MENERRRARVKPGAPPLFPPTAGYFFTGYFFISRC
jgi:hypothetical protein